MELLQNEVVEYGDKEKEIDNLRLQLMNAEQNEQYLQDLLDDK